MTLDLQSTNDTGLSYWTWTKFTVISSGQVIVKGKTSDEAEAAFHIYNQTSAGWKKVKQIKRLCEHDGVDFLPINVNNKEQLAVSCFHCRTIKLYNLDTLDATIAFHDPKYYPGPMCHGENGKLYVMHSVKGGVPVLELDCTTLLFTGPSQIIQSGMETLYSIYYIPSPHKLLVFSENNLSIIRAVSAETGEKVWEVRGEVDGKMCYPHGMLFSPQHQVLLVADGRNSRVLVLHPGDGLHLQTIQLDQEMGTIWEMSFHQNKLVVSHHDDSTHHVSCFSVN